MVNTEWVLMILMILISHKNRVVKLNTYVSNNIAVSVKLTITGVVEPFSNCVGTRHGSDLTRKKCMNIDIV